MKTNGHISLRVKIGKNDRRALAKEGSLGGYKNYYLTRDLTQECNLLCATAVLTHARGTRSRPNGVFTRSSKRPAIHVYFEYICWKFAGRLLDRVNTL